MITNYTNSFVVNKSTAEVFECLTKKIPQWWSTDFEGSSEKPNDEFMVRFDKTFKKFRIESTDENTIIWLCTDQYINIPEIKNKTEWIGTKVIWSILPQDFATKVGILHEGLTPEAECFSVCEKGWNAFIASLFALLEGGDGLPFIKS